MPAGLTAIRRVLAQPAYRAYQSGNAISLVGDWIQRTAVGWLAWELTHSATWLGMLAVVDLAPVTIIGPFAGAIADRYPPRRVIIIGQMVMLALVLVLAALAFADMLGIWLLFSLVLLNGIMGGIVQPARLSLISSLVPREMLATAVALNAMIFNTARFVGPAIAGVMLVLAGTGPAFLLNALTYVFFLVALARLDLPAIPARPRLGSFLGEVGDGIGYVARHPGIGPLVLMFLWSSLTVRPVGELLPGVADRIFERGAEGFAMLSASVGIGAILCGFWLVQRRSDSLLSVCIYGATGLSGVCLAFVMSPSFELALVAALALGAGLTATGVSVQTLMQLAVSPEYRGRTMALFGVVARGGPALGALALGALGDWIGLEPTLVIGALLCLPVLALLATRRRKVAAALVPDER